MKNTVTKKVLYIFIMPFIFIIFSNKKLYSALEIFSKNNAAVTYNGYKYDYILEVNKFIEEKNYIKKIALFKEDYSKEFLSKQSSIIILILLPRNSSIKLTEAAIKKANDVLNTLQNVAFQGNIITYGYADQTISNYKILLYFSDQQ